MRKLLFVLLLLPATLQAQTTFQFAPALGYTWARYSTALFSDGANFGPGFKLRFIGDRDRIQVGGGFEFHMIGDDGIGGEILDGTGAPFACPHFLFNYKVAKWKESYVYTGIIIGAAFGEDGYSTSGSFAKGMTGLDLGYVLRLGNKVDIDLSESFRICNGTNDNSFPTVTPVGSTTSNYFLVQFLTTNIGIRINRSR